MTLKLLLSAALSGTLVAAQNSAPEPPETCCVDDCQPCYCLGPENCAANAPVCPHTCGGDWGISIAGLYWTAHSDRMNYAFWFDTETSSVETLFLKGSWDFGFKLGVEYCSPCDGWDAKVLWTWFQNRTTRKVSQKDDTNRELKSLLGGAPSAGEVKAKWELDLNLIDIEIGREFWTSKYLSIRPFIGVRVPLIKQNFEEQTKGDVSFDGTPLGPSFLLKSADFNGAGLRAGLDSTWNFGCGWALYGNGAVDIVYGWHDINLEEFRKSPNPPFEKLPVFSSKSRFTVPRYMGDLALGFQWSRLICNCNYYIEGQLGWEQHIFVNTNQINGEGDLTTSGVTLAFKFAF